MMSAERNRPVVLGILENRPFAATWPATVDESEVAAAALSYLSAQGPVVSPNSGWVSVQLNGDVSFESAKAVLAHVGSAEYVGVVDRLIAQQYLGESAVNALIQ